MTSSTPITTVLDHLAQSLGQLSLGQRRIAELILRDPDGSAFCTASELAQRAGVSESAVVRFAQSLHYEGFTALREDLLRESQKNPALQSRPMKAPWSASSTLLEAARRDTADLKQLLPEVSEQLFRSAVERLVRARTRLVVGRGLSQHMAETFGFLMTHVGLPCIAGYSSDLRLQVGHLEPSDLVVAFSFEPHASETLDAALMARGRGIPVLAFTNSPGSPLARAAELLLPVSGGNPYFAPSLAVFGVLAGALATAVAEHDPAKALRRMREVQRTAASPFRS